MGWTVVKFINENTVEVIPLSWVKPDKVSCWWPKDTNSIGRYIKNEELPKHDWDTFKIQLMTSQCYQTFSLANKKAFDAKYTSDLSSSEQYENKVVTNKRPQKIPIRFQQESEDSSDESDPGDHAVGYPTPPRSASVNGKSTEMIVEPNGHLTPAEIHKAPIIILTDNNQNEYLPAQDGKDKDDNEQHTDKQMVSEAFFNEILRQLHMINLRLKQQEKSIDIIVKSLTQQSNSELLQGEDEISKYIPVKDEEGLQQLEEKLMDTDLYNNLVRIIRYSGGKDLKEFIRRNMIKLITNEFATQYSWKGARGKKKFMDLKISSAIVDAVRQHKPTSIISQKEVEEAITYWLVKAPERFKKVVA